MIVKVMVLYQINVYKYLVNIYLELFQQIFIKIWYFCINDENCKGKIFFLHQSCLDRINTTYATKVNTIKFK